MELRHPRTEQAKRALAAARGLLAELVEEREQHQAAAQTETAQQSELAADPRKYAKLAESIRAHQVEAERLGHLIARAEDDVAKCEQELARARGEAAVEEHRRRAQLTVEISAQLERELPKLNMLAAQLQAARAATADAKAAAKELLVDGQQLAAVDEAEWAPATELVSVLEHGPARPNAADASASEKFEGEQRAKTEHAARVRAEAEKILGVALDEQGLPAPEKTFGRLLYAASVDEQRAFQELVRQRGLSAAKLRSGQLVTTD